MTDPPSSPVNSYEYKTFGPSDDAEEQRQRVNLNGYGSGDKPIAALTTYDESTLHASEGLLGILKESISVKSARESRRSISWRNDSQTLFEDAGFSNVGASYTSNDYIARPMAPPLKKRLSTNFALGLELPGWSRNALIPTPITVGAATLPASSSSLQKQPMETPRVGKRFVGTTEAHAPQMLAPIGTGLRLMSQPLLETPYPSVYYRNLAAHTVRPIPMPSSVHGNDRLNRSDSDNAQLASYHALNEQRTPFPSREEEGNVPVPFQYAQRTTFPSQEETRNGAFQYAPMSLADALAHFRGGAIEASGRLKREAPSEITNTNMSMLSNAPFAVKVSRGGQPTASSYRLNNTSPELVQSLTTSNDHSEQNRAPTMKHGLVLQPAQTLQNGSSKNLVIFGNKSAATHTTAFSNRLVSTAPRFTVASASTFFSNSGNASGRGRGSGSGNQGCICKRSKCLKLYCKCFQSSQFCDSTKCHCKDCHNLLQYDGPKGERRMAITDIQSRRPDAFDSRPTKRTGEGCSCKKNRCLKKYCDCFANGAVCSNEKCSCVNCENGREIVRPEPINAAFARGRGLPSASDRDATNQINGDDEKLSTALVLPEEKSVHHV